VLFTFLLSNQRPHYMPIVFFLVLSNRIPPFPRHLGGRREPILVQINSVCNSLTYISCRQRSESRSAYIPSPISPPLHHTPKHGCIPCRPLSSTSAAELREMSHLHLADTINAQPRPSHFTKYNTIMSVVNTALAHPHKRKRKKNIVDLIISQHP